MYYTLVVVKILENGCEYGYSETGTSCEQVLTSHTLSFDTRLNCESLGIMLISALWF